MDDNRLCNLTVRPGDSVELALPSGERVRIDVKHVADLATTVHFVCAKETAVEIVRPARPEYLRIDEAAKLLQMPEAVLREQLKRRRVSLTKISGNKPAVHTRWLILLAKQMRLPVPELLTDGRPDIRKRIEPQSIEHRMKQERPAPVPAEFLQADESYWMLSRRKRKDVRRRARQAARQEISEAKNSENTGE